MTALLVGVGGFFGAISRYWLSQRLNTAKVPLGTFIGNMVGSFFLGCLIGGSFFREWVLLLGTGFLGAFTTFSTLNWECIQLYQEREWRKITVYLGVSYLLGMLLAFVGYYLFS